MMISASILEGYELRSIVFIVLSMILASVGRVNADIIGEARGQTSDQSTAKIKEGTSTESQILKPSSKKTKSKSNSKTISGLISRLNHLNSQILDIQDEQFFDELLEKQNQIISELVTALYTPARVKLPAVATKRQINLLSSRIGVNQERGNELAVQRDQAKLAYYDTIQNIERYLIYLNRAVHSYQSVDEIVSHSVELLNLAEGEAEKFPMPDDHEESRTITDLKRNIEQLHLANATYQSILHYILDNPTKIAKTHWFQNFSLLSAISYFNNISFLRPINYKIAPLRIDAGGVIVSFIIALLIIFCYPLVVRGSRWLIRRYILSQGSDHLELIYQAIDPPIRGLLLFFSIDLATYALLYRTEYKGAIESFVFVVYTWIYVWLICRLLDSVVAVQVSEISKTNKELRKELVNLAVNLAKGIILIAAMAVILSHYGISIAAILSTLGIGGLAFALAAKDTLSNLFGGVTILFDNVFRMGDWVKIKDVEGTVAEIGLRSTTIRTFDNALITIPNSIISVASVKNWNRRMVGRRIKMYVGVTYESNIDDIRRTLDDIRQMLKEHPGIADPKEKKTVRRVRYKFSSHEDALGIKSTQLVYLDRFNDFSIDILIYCFSKTVDWADWLAVKEDLLYKIADILKKNHLEFAYPTQVRINRGTGLVGTRTEDAFQPNEV